MKNCAIEDVIYRTDQIMKGMKEICLALENAPLPPEKPVFIVLEV